MLLIPSLDLRAGQSVRLIQGSFDTEMRYTEHPKLTLRRYRGFGAPWVHVVDLDGAREGLRTSHRIIETLAALFLPHLQVGGGVRSAKDIEALLDVGVSRVVVGSAALQRPLEVAAWLERFGRERLCLAFDVRTRPGEDPHVCTNGWQNESTVSLWDALRRYAPESFRHVLCTDVTRDGTLSGPNIELYRTAVARFPGLSWQASGGVRSAADLETLAQTGVSAAVSGRALIEDRIPTVELRSFLRVASSPASTFEPARS